MVNLERLNGIPALMAIVGGNYAYELEKSSDRTIVHRLMEILRRIFGSSIPQPTHTLLTRWANDPFSFGSYVFVPIHQTASYFDDLARPVDQRLFFAGEGTMRRFPTTIHGAYLSGIREAKRIAQLHS